MRRQTSWMTLGAVASGIVGRLRRRKRKGGRGRGTTPPASDRAEGDGGARLGADKLVVDRGLGDPDALRDLAGVEPAMPEGESARHQTRRNDGPVIGHGRHPSAKARQMSEQNVESHENTMPTRA